LLNHTRFALEGIHDSNVRSAAKHLVVTLFTVN
jgi:hypothetical protein